MKNPLTRKNKVKKERLKTRVSQHSFLNWRRVVGYGFRSFTRNAWLSVAATVVMVITLSIIFITFLASLTLRGTIDSQKDKLVLSFYIRSDASDDTLRNLEGKIRLQPNIESLTLSTSKEEYNKALKENSEGFSAISSIAGIKQTFPSVFHVKLDDINRRQELQDFIKKDPQFQEWIDKDRTNSSTVDTKKNTINRLSEIMNWASLVGLIAGAMFTVISVLIIFNTIRMAIFSRREEISMMKAIGADNYFIRTPFLVEARICGLLAALITAILGYLTSAYLLPKITYIQVSYTQEILSEWWWLILLALVAIGYIIGDLSARLALRRYLKPSHFQS